jgi:RIO-like serine/threonine protein kinase
MDDTDIRIIKAINSLSPKSFISPVKVNEILKLDANQLGTRLMLLKKSGHVDIIKKDYPSSLTLPNAISKVFLTELGRKTLKDKK